jgi:hypothetical protein
MAWLHDWAEGTHCNFASMQTKWDTDGKGWLYCYAAAVACTAKYDYAICKSERGWYATTIWAGSDTAALHYIGISKDTIATGSYGWFQIAGWCSDAIISTSTGTIGDAIKEASGAVLTVGTTATGFANEFAVFGTTGTSGITHNIVLFPIMIDGQD